jgi:transcriptional regulator with XRE-family HTH domain
LGRFEADVKLREVSTHIARRLTARRAQLGLSLAEVSRRCGVTFQQIHRYETASNTISAPMLWQLSKCLDVDIRYFFGSAAALTEKPPIPSRTGGCGGVAPG